MRLKFFVSIVLAFIYGIAFANEKQEPYNFHGMQLGSTEQSILKQFPEFECKDEGPIRRCQGYFTLSKHPGILSFDGATNVALVFAENKLANIHVMWFPAIFDESHKKFEEAYGIPMDRKMQKFKTSDEHVFENSITTWHNKVSTVRYEKYWQNIGVSRILYMLK